MAFRETIGAEAFDLMEAAFGKVLRVAARRHAVDHLGEEAMDGARIAERRHRATKLVGFLRRELRRLDGDAHRLLLKQRHAQRSAKHLFQLVGQTESGAGDGRSGCFQPLAPA